MKELWRNIDGYKGVYQVSSFGRIRSYKYNLPRILKPRVNKKGYKYINLCLDGKYKSLSVHRLVAKTFIAKSDLTVNHKNGNKLNNCVDNLEFITITENLKHAKENNLLAKGENNGRSKLKKRDVDLIRFKHKNNKSIRCLSKEFGVSRSVIGKIINKLNWN
jgi:hypothetical protein